MTGTTTLVGLMFQNFSRSQIIKKKIFDEKC